MSFKNVTKYLQHYSESEVQYCAEFPSERCFEYVLVIPAYKESIDFISRYCDSPLAKENTLLICVINQPCCDNNTSPQEKLCRDIHHLGTAVWQEKNLSLIKHHTASQYTLVVDKYTQAIVTDEGVGKARKVGADIATYLINKNIIQTPWIFSTDADAHLPPNYFSVVKEIVSNGKSSAKPKQSHLTAICYNFTHESTNKNLHQANAQYEQALRYFVKGLQFANSPYAFFTIGSLWVYEVNAYATVRGFPKRSAGEDFYLINKISKLGPVHFLQDTVIRLDARDSDRVPFGTGPAVQKILQNIQDNMPYMYYHPEVFSALKYCLAAFSTLESDRESYKIWESHLPITISRGLKNIGFEHFFNKQSRVSDKQFCKQLTIWFDAFKTLKFIHGIRENGLNDIPLTQALEMADFWNKKSK